MNQTVSLPGRFKNHKFFHLAETGSTNTDLKKFLETSRDCDALFLADHQTSGRGQYGRSWLSRPGQALMFSFSENRWARRFPPSLYAGLCLIRAISCFKLPAAKIWLKWPNDVWSDQRKLAGILTEAISVDDVLKLAVGVGLNLRPLCEDSLKSISLEEMGISVSAIEMMSAILRAWDELSEYSDQRLSQIWREKAGDFWHHEYKFLDPDQKSRTGTPVDINEDGVLKMASPEGDFLIHSASLLPVFE